MCPRPETYGRVVWLSARPALTGHGSIRPSPWSPTRGPARIRAWRAFTRKIPAGPRLFLSPSSPASCATRRRARLPQRRERDGPRELPQRAGRTEGQRRGYRSGLGRTHRYEQTSALKQIMAPAQ